MEHTQSSKDFCPSCGGTHLDVHSTVVDHFLTKELFVLKRCNTCSFLFTTPRPSLDKIGEYYKSEDYVSHSSTKKGLVNTVYGWVRNYTLKQKTKLISRLVTGRDLLDIGAGTGHFAAKAKQKSWNVTGLEPDPDARKVAKELNKIDLEDLSLLQSLENQFDCVTMWHVLEHVYNLNEDLDKIATLIKSNGVFVIAVPNYTSFDAQYYQEEWAAYDVPRHLYHFSPKTIVSIIEKRGFDFEEILPMKFDSYYVSMLSEKYRKGSIFNAIRVGFLSNMKAGKDKCSSQIYIFRKK